MRKTIIEESFNYDSLLVTPIAVWNPYSQGYNDKYIVSIDNMCLGTTWDYRRLKRAKIEKDIKVGFIEPKNYSNLSMLKH